ncbi:hypothetical protein GGR51DRAFT_521007 [Nemania sp. FL0031]|nr:hypothetical protein GGR51DRAFT_521007 [Nemania sp. FL0031]
MPRRGEASGTEKTGNATGRGFSSALPTISSYWSRGGRASRTRDMNAAAFDRRMENSPTRPTQPAPFTPNRRSHGPSAPTSARKVSASFSTDCPLSGHPTTAYSAVTASTTLNRPRPLTSHPINRSSAFPFSQSYGDMGTSTVDGTPRPSHTYSNLPMPAKQSKVPSSKPSTAPAPTDARVPDGRNTENIPPSASMASITTDRQSTSKYTTPRSIPKSSSPKKKAKSRPGIPKSLTFNVLSNLTASLSRTSLGQLTSNDSRRTSISSKGVPYTNSQWESSTSSQALSNPTVETANPRQIYTAQSSMYWTGRFIALQDRFQSEALTPANLSMLVHAHAERSLIPMAQPSLASSATMSCIAPAAKSNLNLKPTRTVTISTSPSKSHPKRPLRVGPRAIPKLSQSTTTVASNLPPYGAAAALLVDDDNRARRIFLHLDSLCATNEARMSLRQWQQSYARRTGKESLLPEGGTMQERTRERTWVGRLLIGSGGGHSRRGSLVS